MQLKIQSHHHGCLDFDHSEAVVVVDAGSAALVQIHALTEGFEADRIEISPVSPEAAGTVEVSYAGGCDHHEDSIPVATIRRADGGDLVTAHGNHSEDLGTIQAWVLEPSAVLREDLL